MHNDKYQCHMAASYTYHLLTIISQLLNNQLRVPVILCQHSRCSSWGDPSGWHDVKIPERTQQLVWLCWTKLNSLIHQHKHIPYTVQSVCRHHLSNVISQGAQCSLPLPWQSSAAKLYEHQTADLLQLFTVLGYSLSKMKRTCLLIIYIREPPV